MSRVYRVYVGRKRGCRFTVCRCVLKGTHAGLKWTEGRFGLNGADVVKRRNCGLKDSLKVKEGRCGLNRADIS